MELISFLNYERGTKVYQAKNGDKEAFLSLIEQNKMNVYRVARGILNNQEDIKDAVQSTLIKAFENIHTLRKEKYFKTWLIRILINECNEILRKGRRCVPLDEGIVELANHSADSYENMDLIGAINSLSEDLRAAVTLFYFDDFSVRDIADILKISEGTVKSRLSRARTKLKEILGEDE